MPRGNPVPPKPVAETRDPITDHIPHPPEPPRTKEVEKLDGDTTKVTY
jgi:hypothetical protein